MIPVTGTPFGGLPLVSMAEIRKIRTECAEILPQMLHCRQCRADAAGTLDDDRSYTFASEVGKKPEASPEKRGKLYAVASKSGFVIDLHFGMASEFYIYEKKDGRFKFLERRRVDKYCGGKEDCGEKENKIDRILNAVGDCAAVLCTRIGGAPSERLQKAGIEIFETYDAIESGLQRFASADIPPQEKNEVV
jgi:predicted Fe-Mo cluster-binding NifX family protein